MAGSSSRLLSRRCPFKTCHGWAYRQPPSSAIHLPTLLGMESMATYVVCFPIVDLSSPVYITFMKYNARRSLIKLTAFNAFLIFGFYLAFLTFTDDCL